MPESTVASPHSQIIFQQIEAGDLDAMRRVLDADPMLANARHADPEKHHWSALQFAAAEGKLDACRLLVERGAEVYTNPMNTYPPVIQAAWNHHQEVVDYFLNEIPDRAEGTNGIGVMLNLAAREGWVELVRRHIEADPLSVYQRGWIGDSPLHWPSHNNFVEIVALMLDAGAVIEADEINCYGGKPLHWASEHAPGAVELLLSRGANVNSRNIKRDSDLFGMTPLIMNATQHNDCGEAAELLCAAGADVNATDGKGHTALDHALHRKLGQITAVLVKYGAREAAPFPAASKSTE
ncbi:MAG TPA: ankyrin repeat domain-containing protein [Armatimonadota bacterium]|nr:ankyrin repeat domain-containing protein [Armatimonadota bacterium]